VYNSYRGCDVFCGSFSVVRNVNGSGEVVLPIPEGTASTWAPTFSPDGSKIAVEIWGYNETLGEFDGIFIMDADGANQQMLTNPWAEADMWDEVPSFTKDGTQIVFSREDHSSETFSEHVYIMNVDGTGVTALSSGATINNDPLILGDRILFNSSRDNPDSARGTGFEIYTMNLDGTGITRLTNNALFDGFCGEYYESEETSAAHYQQLRPAKRLHH
jgi:Tol biopolymer transport system component